MTASRDAGRGAAALRMLLSCAAASIVAISGFLLALRTNSVQPFGDTSILVEDFKYQYVDFLRWYRNVLLGDASAAWSPYGALGFNAFGLVSYYLLSPINALVVLFDGARITDFVVMACCLRVGLLAFVSALFAGRRFSLPAIYALVPAVSFALSSWCVSNLQNYMWVDAAIMAPLTLLALHELVTRKRWLGLSASIAVTVVLNWYIGYMSVVGVVLAIPLLCELASESGDGAHVASLTLASLLMGVSLSGIVLVPTVSAMVGAGASSIAVMCAALLCGMALSAYVIAHGLPGRAERILDPAFRYVVPLVVAIMGAFSVYSFLSDVPAAVSGFFSSARAGFDGGASLGFVGGVAASLAVADIASRHHTRDARLQAAILMFTLSCACWASLVGIMMCGFRFPNGFYGRAAYPFSVLVLWLASDAMAALRDGRLSFDAVFASSIAAFSVAALCGMLLEIGDVWVFLAGAACVCVSAFVAHAGHAAASAALMSSVCVATMWASASLRVKSEYDGSYSASYHDSYVAAQSDAANRLRDMDGGQYRIDQTSSRYMWAARDEGMALSQMRLSTYSSAADSRVVRFINSLGYTGNRPGDGRNDHKVCYTAPIFASDSLLGVRYVLSSNEFPAVSDTGIRGYDGQRLWRNDAALPLAYAIPSGEAPDVVEDAPADAQDSFLSFVAGRDVDAFTMAAGRPSGSSSSRTWTVHVPSGHVLYARVIDDGTGSGITVSPSDLPRGYMEGAYSWHAMHPVSRERGEDADVDVTIMSSSGVEDADVEFWLCDMSEVREVLDGIDRDAADVRLDGTHIGGAVTSDGRHDLLLTMPNDSGWHITVDGKAADAHGAYGDALTVIRLGEGRHEISGDYHTPGLVPGACMTLLGVAACASMRRREKRCA